MVTSSAATIALTGDGNPSRAGIYIFVALVIVAAIVVVIQKSRRK